MSAEKLLSQLLAKSPLFPNNLGSVLRVFEDTLVLDAFRKMIEHKVISLPIVKHTDGTVVEIITMLDVVNYFISIFKEEELLSFSDKVIAEKQEIAKTTVTQIKLEATEPIITADEDQTMFEVAKLLISKKVRRVIIVNKQNELVNLVSASRLMELLSVDVDKHPNAKKTISELGLATKEVFTIEDKAIAREAFKMMVEKKVRGVAIVDKDGKLVGNLSGNDIKVLGYDLKYFGMLAATNSVYLDELRRCDPQRTVADTADPVRCSGNATFGEVIALIHRNRVHRVYVVDENQKPIGVVSIFDVLEKLLE
eukprot:TRINITY_DN1331_c0_g1_i1.p1 TRINITY_DN1331_c0_g1~~TRINITY_DN1331_c0_g1_i1.p1  ORF type:complete len:310 (-),score=101.16 TRINITY_DN1331_c0_g1_i1:81-1010(-)